MIKDDYMKVPEIYAVDPSRMASEEESSPSSSDPQQPQSPGGNRRVAQGRIPFMWAQSLWVIGKLLQEKFIAPGELDPTNRRLTFGENRPEVIVQASVI